MSTPRPNPHRINFTSLWRRYRKLQPFDNTIIDPADETLLRSIQGNVLKSHGRDFSALVMFRFDGDDSSSRLFVRSWLSDNLLTTAWQQLLDQWDYKAAKAATLEGTPPTNPTPAQQGMAPFRTIALTQAGIAALKLSVKMTPTDMAFASGMEATHSRYKLGDLAEPGDAGTAADPWTTDAYLQPIHAIMLLAHGSEAELDDLITEATNRGRARQVAVVKVEKGFNWKPGGGDMREPFGFADGISNPVFIEEDAITMPGPPPWVPASQVLLDGPATLVGGSYLIFRKLEQDMPAFATFENDLRQAGAGIEALIGRQRSGAPLVAAGPRGRNDFDYTADQVVPSRCPFHAHIRKANARVDMSHAFVRRSHVFAGTGGPGSAALGGARGLLFLAYMSSIVSQFQLIQETWLMADTSAEPGLGGMVVGPDPLLAPAGRYALNAAGQMIALAQPRLVVPRGGRYAFLPALAWIGRLPA